MSRREAGPGLTLAGFGLALGLALGGGFALGTAVGPVGPATPETGHSAPTHP